LVCLPPVWSRESEETAGDDQVIIGFLTVTGWLDSTAPIGLAFRMTVSLIDRARFVILLNGRHAGKKAVVLTASLTATEDRKYPHALVLGIEKYPKKLTKDMSQETLVKRTQVRCFVKTVNFNHLLLTRHTLKDDDFWNKVKVPTILDSLGDKATKKQTIENLSGILRQKYLNGKHPWFFKPLQF
jgi:large subunit ribosomal protein L27e